MNAVLKEKLKKAIWDEKDRWELVDAFVGIIKYWARKYASDKEGVVDQQKAEELIQAGYPAAYELIPKCRKREKLASFLFLRLRGALRDEAERQWGKSAYIELDDEEVDPDTIRELTCEPDFDEGIQEARAQSFLKRHLKGRNLKVAQCLYHGCKQPKAAKCLKVSQSTVSRCVRENRKKAGKALEEFLKDE